MSHPLRKFKPFPADGLFHVIEQMAERAAKVRLSCRKCNYFYRRGGTTNDCRKHGKRVKETDFCNQFEPRL